MVVRCVPSLLHVDALPSAIIHLDRIAVVNLDRVSSPVSIEMEPTVPTRMPNLTVSMRLTVSVRAKRSTVLSTWIGVLSKLLGTPK